VIVVPVSFVLTTFHNYKGVSDFRASATVYYTVAIVSYCDTVIKSERIFFSKEIVYEYVGLR
jgi:hypothetical protein